MKKTSNECKLIAQAALRAKYGFNPAMKDIKIITRNDSGTKIYFAIDGHEYKFNSYIATYGDIKAMWVGDGTITKL